MTRNPAGTEVADELDEEPLAEEADVVVVVVSAFLLLPPQATNNVVATQSAPTLLEAVDMAAHARPSAIPK
jgi:hypothetical protein